ncbi:MAG: RNA polymerase sigma factor [Bacteroidales bacterium]
MLNESEIIIQILQGNRNLYKFLVEKYQSMIFRTCLGFLHNKNDADDLTQEIFIQVYQTLSKFRGDSAFSTWIYRIAVNAALNKVRKSRKNLIFEQIESIFDPEKKKTSEITFSENDNPETILILQEHREWLKNALNKLPEKQQTAIVLSKYDELSQKEIAEIMNTTEGAVEALIQRAKANLRAILVPEKKKNKKLP